MTIVHYSLRQIVLHCIVLHVNTRTMHKLTTKSALSKQLRQPEYATSTQFKFDQSSKNTVCAEAQTYTEVQAYTERLLYSDHSVFIRLGLPPLPQSPILCASRQRQKDKLANESSSTAFLRSRLRNDQRRRTMQGIQYKQRHNFILPANIVCSHSSIF